MDKIQDYGEALLNGSQKACKAATIAAAAKFGPNVCDGLYLSLMTALGPMIPASMLAAKRPTFTKEELERQDEEELLKLAAGLVKPETVFFVALATAHMLHAYSVETTTTEFGPPMLARALDDWQKLFPNAKPEQYFTKHMLEAIRQAKTEEVPEEIKKKFGFFLPGNGSIN